MLTTSVKRILEQVKLLEGRRPGVTNSRRPLDQEIPSTVDLFNARKGKVTVNSDVDHSGEKKPRTCKFTRRPEPRSPEVNEGHQIWAMHSDH
jgi:hypothetical protein